MGNFRLLPTEWPDIYREAGEAEGLAFTSPKACTIICRSALEKNGTIETSMLFAPPFTDVNDQGLLGVFDDAQTTRVLNLLEKINENVEVA